MTTVYSDASKVDAPCTDTQKFDNLTSRKYNYQWRVYKNDNEQDIQLESPSIRTDNGASNLVWKLFYWFNYSTRHDLVGFKLIRCDHHTRMKVCAECAIYKCNDSEYRSIEISGKKLDISAALATHNYSTTIDGPFNDRNKSIIVELSIEIVKEVQVDVICKKLSRDLEILLEDESLKDVTLFVGEEKFKAHKLILTARSPVFTSMFTCDMQESKTNQVTIDDIEPEIFEQLLRFIYTGRVPKSDSEDMEALITAADKYAISDLKTFCGDIIITKINVQKAADILILADLVRCEEMKLNAMKFILANKSQVIDTDGYKAMAKSHLHLFEEMFRLSEAE